MTPEGVRKRVFGAGMSGLPQSGIPPRDCPGHRTPEQPTARELSDQSGAPALGDQPPENIPRT